MNPDQAGEIHTTDNEHNYKDLVINKNRHIIDVQAAYISYLEGYIGKLHDAFWWKITKPMRVICDRFKLLFKTIIKPFAGSSQPTVSPVVYNPQIPAKANKTGRNILFVMHCLHTFGATVVLADMVRIVLENGDNPTVLSSDDGPLRDEYLDLGITVTIDPSFLENPSAFRDFAQGFDLVVANTLGCGKAVSALADSQIPVLWWIHEPPDILRAAHNEDIPAKISPYTKVYSVSAFCAKLLSEVGLLYDYNILNFGIPDTSLANAAHEYVSSDAVTFLTVGNSHEIKGTDVLLKAIESIDKKLLSDVRFIFIGRNNIPPSPIDLLLCRAASENDCIFCLDFMPREELLKWYCQADCVIVPSRVETVSAVVVEAAMLSKPSICSNQVGAATDYVTVNENGLIFPGEDYMALANCITFAINNRDKIAQMGKNARKDIYEKHFTIDIYKQNALKAIDDTITATGRE